MRIYMKAKGRKSKKMSSLRIISAAALAIFGIFLVSCSFIPGYTEPEDQYMISALGFDEEGDELVVSAQTSSEEGKVLAVYRGRGDSIEYAMAHLEGTDAKRIELGHCGAVVIGESVSAERLREILDYCRRNDDVTVSAGLGTAHNAFELLSREDASGYAIMRAMRKGEDGNGISEGGRLYSALDVLFSGKRGGVFALPYFALDEEAWSLWGLRLFRNCERLTLLDRSESVIYTMVSGSFGSGMADVVVDSVRYSALFRSCKRKVCLDGDVISVRCKLLLDSEIRPPIDEKTLTRAMSESAGELCRQLMERYGDVFGIADAMDIGGEELESVDVRVVFE